MWGGGGECGEVGVSVGGLQLERQILASYPNA